MEIDLNRIVKKPPHAKKSLVRSNTFKQASKTSSRDVSFDRKSIIGPSYVHRRDAYEDNMGSFLDTNIEEIAKLSALKLKL